MSEPSASSSTPGFKPYVSAETEMTESTIGAIVLADPRDRPSPASSTRGLKIGLTRRPRPDRLLAIQILRASEVDDPEEQHRETHRLGRVARGGVAFTRRRCC